MKSKNKTKEAVSLHQKQFLISEDLKINVF
jgi:hypothetical protein